MENIQKRGKPRYAYSDTKPHLSRVPTFNEGINSAGRSKTAVTVYLKSKQLLLFAFTRHESIYLVMRTVYVLTFKVCLPSLLANYVDNI